MTPVRVSVIAAIATIILLVVIFELIRSRRLQERYAMLWLLSAIVILVLAVWRGALSRLADLVGIAYPPSALLLLYSGPAFALLHGDLPPVRSESDSRSEARAAGEPFTPPGVGTAWQVNEAS